MVSSRFHERWSIKNCLALLSFGLERSYHCIFKAKRSTDIANGNYTHTQLLSGCFTDQCVEILTADQTTAQKTSDGVAEQIKDANAALRQPTNQLVCKVYLHLHAGIWEGLAYSVD